MPMNKKRYPANWSEISFATIQRAGDKCEKCGVPNHTWVIRSAVDGARWAMEDPDTSGCLTSDGTLYKWSEAPEEFRGEKPIQVILTTHHKGVDKPDGTPGDKEDKMDCRDENLAALCQRCHFIADRDENIKKAAVTRGWNKRRDTLANGQSELEGLNDS